ncbi:MAG: VanW family protein [Lachnospiraceae bacterium]
MKKLKKIVPILLLVLVMGSGVLVYMTVTAAPKSDTIQEGIYIGDISVGGLTQEEAAKQIEKYVADSINTEFILQAGEKEITANGSELGVFWLNEDICQEAYDIGRNGNLITRFKDIKDLEHEDKVIDVTFALKVNQTRKFLKNHLQELNLKAVNNGLSRENGEFIFLPGKKGCKVKVEESIAFLQDYITNEWDKTSNEISLICKTTNPKGTKKELAEITDVLGSYTTDYSSSSSGRAKNVENGATRINGTVLYPGETFSVYKAVSPFTAENGYELAGSYENGTTVQSYGGGICQVSTTLYNAVLLSELTVEERHNHSMIVSYVPASMDAAIAGTYKDLKFSNNLDTPIYIEGYAGGGRISFNIYGSEKRDTAGRTVTYESETTETTDPTVQFVAVDQKIGYYSQVQSAHTGYIAKLWKIVTVDGVQESKEVINNSTYKSSPEIFEVGTASKSKEATAAIKAAIATGDKEKVAKAMAEYNDAALAKEEQIKEEENKKDPEKEDPGKEDPGEEDGNKKNNQIIDE